MPHEANCSAGREVMCGVVDRGAQGLDAFDNLVFGDEVLAFGLESSESGGVSMVART